MGSLNVEITEYGTWNVTTSSGAQYRLNDRNGRLEIRVQVGGLIVHPRSSNVVELAATNWDEMEVRS